MASAPQPALLFSFNGSNVESVTGLSPTLTTGTPTYVTGLYGQAALFNQTSSSAGPPTANIVYNLSSFNLTANSLTFSSWIQPLVPIPISGLNICYVSLTDTESDYSIGMNSSVSTTNPFVYNPVGGNRIDSSIPFVTGVWFNNVITLSNVGQTGQNTLMKYYINGALIGSLTITRSAISVINNLFCACYKGANVSYCALQDLRVYNTPLTAAQVYGIYQSRGIPPRVTFTQSNGPSNQITITPTSGILPTPTYLWPFQGSTVDVIKNKDTSASNVAGAYTATNTNQFYPYYDTTGQKAGTSSLQLLNVNTPGSPSNTLTYSTLSGLPVDNTGNAVTVSFWFKWITYNFAYSYILSLPFGGGGSTSLDTNGGFLYLNGGSIPGTSFTPGRTTLVISSAGTWYHVTLVFTAAQVLVYGNGAFVGNGIGGYTNQLTVQQGTSNTITSFNLGFVGITQFSSVEIADFRIYNSALNASQIQEVYTSGGVYSPVVQPTYMWPFQNSTVDVIQGKGTNTSNVSGGYTAVNTNQLYPYYDTTTPLKTGQSAINLVNFGTTSSNCLEYTGLSAPFGSSNALTVSMWVAANQPWTTTQSIIKFNAGSGGSMGCSLSYGGASANVFQLGGSAGGGAYNGGAAFTFPTFVNAVVGTFYHLAFIQTGTSIQPFLNGVPGNLITASVDGNAANVFTSFFFAGIPNAPLSLSAATIKVNDLRIYNTALTAAQISSLYTAGGGSLVTNAPLSGGLIQPTYMWPFNGSTIDVIQGASMASGNIAGVNTFNNSVWPYYDTTGQRVGNSAIILNNPGTQSSNTLAFGSVTCYFPFTVCLWVKTSVFGSGGGNNIVFKFIGPSGVTAGYNGNTFSIYHYSSTLVQAVFSGTGGLVVTASTPPSLNTWLHVGVVIAQNPSAYIYINGLLAGYGSGGSLPSYLSPPFSYNTPALVGGLGTGTIGPATIQSAEYNDLRIYSGTALNSSQILGIYNSGGVYPSSNFTSGS